MLTMTARRKADKDRLISTSEAAEELGVTDIRVRQLINSDMLPASKVGRDWLIRLGDLELVRPRLRPRKSKNK